MQIPVALLLILVPIAFNAVFFALARSFEYPAILRKRTDYILQRFSAGGTRLIALWYAFALTALLLIPLGMMFPTLVFQSHGVLPFLAAINGTLSGTVQMMGLLRWSLVVPSLAAQYNAADASQATKDTIAVVFNSLHHYAGVVIGEHLGYIFTGAWTLMIAAMMFSTPPFTPLLGVIGIIAALGILCGLAEPFGLKPAGAINAASYIVWSLWLIASGVVLILG
jgi:hypothetical protein